MATLHFFNTNVVPKLLESGNFGDGVELVEAVQDSTKATDQFASSVLFVNVKLKVDASIKTIPMVCKFQPESKEVRRIMRTDLQFFNEVLVYKEIVPMFPACVQDLLPKFHFGESTLDGAAEDVVVLQSATPLGYRLSDEKVFLDFEHCCLVFRKLGEFHGGGIELKSSRPEEFASKTGRLLETRWSGASASREETNYFYGENAKRGVLPLVGRGEHSAAASRLLERLDDAQGVVEDVFAPNDNALLCHGDFCRNNILFRYENGEPVDAKFFDLATARRASPVVDISFFLFLNTDAELRRRHFQRDFLRAYLEGVRSVVPGALSEDVLRQEFREKAVYGYLVAAFFLPLMLDDLPDITVEQRQLMTLEQRVQTNLIRGGQKVTDILTEIVRDLIDWGCVR